MPFLSEACEQSGAEPRMKICVVGALINMLRAAQYGLEKDQCKHMLSDKFNSSINSWSIVVLIDYANIHLFEAEKLVEHVTTLPKSF